MWFGRRKDEKKLSSYGENYLQVRSRLNSKKFVCKLCVHKKSHLTILLVSG